MGAPYMIRYRAQRSLHTHSRHIHVMCEGLMFGRARQRLHDLAVSRVCPSPQSTFEEKVERDRAVAPPMVAESRLRRTVRGPGTPAADAALVSVEARRFARCRQLQERL